eukprot:gene8681-17922_t
MENGRKPRIGVLAIQGAVQEHIDSIHQAGGDTVEIRLPSHITDIDGIILPGGESTAMAIVGERWGLFPALQDWVKNGRPIWGTCAGMILLSDHAIKQKTGGQALIGGLDVNVCRNYFGPQIHSQTMSLEIPLEMKSSLLPTSPSKGTELDVETKCEAVFIRAPAILKVGPSVTVLAKIKASPCDDIEVIVAVRQGDILATAFHPELTSDIRWH